MKQIVFKVLIACTLIFISGLSSFCHAKTLTQAEKIQNKEETVNIDWWKNFNDPILTDYLQKSLQTNKDLKIAELRVEEYRQLMKAAFGDEFPKISTGGDLGVQKYSKTYLRAFSGVIENYSFPLKVSYELDIWRKNAAKTKSHKKQLDSFIFDQKSSMLSIISEVASVYFNILNANSNIELQNRRVEIYKNKLKLVELRNEAGISSYDEVLQAEKELADSQIVFGALQKELSTLKTSLCILIGDSPENASELKFGDIEKISLPKNFAESSELLVKSDKVLVRPDILSSEATLQKAKIDVSIARKEFFPNIILSGQMGYNSTRFEKVFRKDSFSYNYNANIAEVIFSGGKRRAMLKSKKYIYEQMLESYQKTILSALKEVNDSLVSIKTSEKRTKDSEIKLNSDKNILKLSKAKEEQGLLSLLEVLSPEERYISSQQESINSRTAMFIDVISLYKSLGGGF